MANSSYSDKLRNPLWQKKRLDILNRDNFTCQICSDTETELHVHHKKYTKGKEPWEYEDDNFQTLCKICHEVAEVYKKLNFTPILAAKSPPHPEFPIIHITTILKGEKNTLIASIDRFGHDYKMENIDVLEQEKISEIHNLFTHAEKLIK